MARFRRHRRWIVIGALIGVVLMVGTAMLLLRPSISASSGGVTATPTLIASLCTAGSAPAAFMATEGTGAMFPCSPNRSVLTVTTPLGTIQTIYYVAELDGKRYEIMIADYGKVFSGGLTGILRGIVLNRTKASTMEEYLMQERTSEAITLNESSGELISADDGTRAARIKLYVVGKKLYRIAVSAPIADVESAQLRAFLDSFSIPKE